MERDGRRLKPRLERRNAMKNIEYQVDNDDEDDDVYSFQYLQNESSLRVKGIDDGEFDHILRSLGLSGPEDFAIPASAWEQSQLQKQHKEPPPFPSPSPTPSIHTHSISQSKVFVQNRDGGGIKGVRPPVLASPAMLRPLVAAAHDQVNSIHDLMRTTTRRSHDVGVVDLSTESGRETEPLSDTFSSSTSHGHHNEIEIRGVSDGGSAEEEQSSSSVHNVSPNGSFSRWTFSSWQKGEILGKGSFGTVYEGFTDDGIFFAVKEVSLLDDGSQGKQSIFQLQQEISLLSQFQHENIVQYFGTDKDDHKLYIFLELVSKGSLASLYQKYRLKDSQVSSYTRQILSGLKYLHVRNVVHRDIKCANILVDANGSVKLADFGLAKATKLNDVKSSKGSPYWMAPEVVNMRNRGYGLAADIWSLGCTVLEMLTRQPPYSHLEGMQALFRIGRGQPPPVPESLSKDARDFVLKCLQVNPNKRPTAAQLLDHPFVKRPLLSPMSPASPVEPTCVTHTMKYPEWKPTMSEEFYALIRNGTWTLVSSQPNLNIVGSKRILQLKHNNDRSIIACFYHARLVFTLRLSP